MATETIRAKRRRRMRRMFHYDGAVDGVYGVVTRFWKKQWLKVHIREQKNLCAICGREMMPVSNGGQLYGPDCASLDHIKPLADGGIHIFSNTRAVHAYCNSAREAVEK